jgi:hypothetical protein
MPVRCFREQSNVLAVHANLRYKLLNEENALYGGSHGSDVCGDSHFKDGVRAKQRFDDKLEKLKALADYTVKHRSLKRCSLQTFEKCSFPICQLGMRLHHFASCFPDMVPSSRLAPAWSLDSHVNQSMVPLLTEKYEMPPQLEGAKPIFILALSKLLSSFTKFLDNGNMLPEWQSCKFNPAGLNISAIIDYIKNDESSTGREPIQHWDNAVLHQMFGQDCTDVRNYVTMKLNAAMADLALKILKDVRKKVLDQLRIRSEMHSEEPLPDPQGVHDKIGGIIKSIVNRYEELRGPGMSPREANGRGAIAINSRAGAPTCESVYDMVYTYGGTVHSMGSSPGLMSASAVMWLITFQLLTTLRV